MILLIENAVKNTHFHVPKWFLMTPSSYHEINQLKNIFNEKGNFIIFHCIIKY